MKHLNKIKIFASVFSFIMIYSLSANAQWDVPASAKNKKAPVDPTHALVKTGKDVYTSNCASCHGTPGQGNNIAAIHATDFGNSDFQTKNTEGSVYYKLEEGKGGMPSFKDKFSADDKWCLAFYIKSFDKDFKITGEKLKAQKGNLKLNAVDMIKTVKAFATTKDDKGNDVPLKGADVQFFVKRMFGNLPIGNIVSTDENGVASVKIDEELPGNEKGEIVILAKFKDSDTYGKVVKSKTVAWGTKLHYKDITKERHMWGANDRVPLWILLSYIIVTVGVWLVIGYVALQLIRLKNVGKN